MGKQAPSPSDYRSAAQGDASYSQAQADRQTQANRPNVSTPFGGVQWTQGPGGQWQMSTSLSPEVQAAYGNMTPFSLSDFAPAGNGDTARQQTIDSAYNAATSRLDPRFRQAGESLNTNLANQGLDPNSAAARNAQRELAAQRNDAYSGAMASAVSEGNRAGSDVFRNNMMARQSAIAEALRARQLPLDDLRGLMGFLPGAQGFNTAGRGSDMQGLQAAGMQDQAAMQKWMAEMQANSDLAGGIFKGLTGGLSGLFALSDERLKTDVRRLDREAAPGVPWAEWRWKDGGEGFGVIAQDVQRVRPECVATGPGGFLMVDYGRLLEVT